jgi:hypothetical protein
MSDNKKKAINYPSSESETPGFIQHAYTVLDDGIAVKYGITTAEMIVLENHNTNVPLVIQNSIDTKQAAQESTQKKHKELFSAKTDYMRIFKKIVEAPNFDEADAEALGIRVEKTPPDLHFVKPVIMNIIVLPDKIIFEWVKGTLNGVFIESSYDKENWTLLEKDNRSPYEDIRKNQKAGVPELRYYRFRYFKNDVAVGQFSDIITVNCDIE